MRKKAEDCDCGVTELGGSEIYMSRIIVLVGSVRKGGNTELLAKAFADGAGQKHDVELVSVADYSIHPCVGCNGCYTSEGHRCVQRDDMDIIYEKLRQADIVIIASPVYFYGISAQLKGLIDRLHPYAEGFSHQKFRLAVGGSRHTVRSF